ncbi:hypothetical protein IKH83_03715 [Candidatus Saccharibacteria bacterium]|nr:hypothetical protein [Candidatus Saccharibacteria bacterium]
MDNNSSAPIAAPAKGGKGSAVGMVIFGILAIAGVGFGVYGMLKKPAAQDLKIQVKDSSGEITTIDASKIEKTDGGKTITITDSSVAGNIIIKDTDTHTYSMPLIAWGNGSIYAPRGDYNRATFNVSIRNGELTDGSCRVYLSNYDDANLYKGQDCAISGFSGKIAKAVLAVSGQDATESNTRIVFLMEDGTAQYVTTTELIDNENVTAKKLDIDGTVVDIVHAGVTEKDAVVGGGATTLFVLSDGSTVSFSKFLQ